jgi:hypothetical protein
MAQSHRQVNSQQLQELVRNAQQLDSRFDKGATQKSFL